MLEQSSFQMASASLTYKTIPAQQRNLKIWEKNWLILCKKFNKYLLGWAKIFAFFKIKMKNLQRGSSVDLLHPNWGRQIDQTSIMTWRRVQVEFTIFGMILQKRKEILRAKISVTRVANPKSPKSLRQKNFVLTSSRSNKYFDKFRKKISMDRVFELEI